MKTLFPPQITFYRQNDFTYSFGPVVAGSSVGTTPPTYADDCSGTMTLLDAYGKAVPGVNAVPLAKVEGQSGMYSVSVAGSDFDLPVGSSYRLLIELDSPTYGHGCWKIPARVLERTA